MGNDDDRTLVTFGTGDGDGNEAPGRLIRRQWHDGRWFFSVVDVVGFLTDSAEHGNYWTIMNQRPAKEGADQASPTDGGERRRG